MRCVRRVQSARSPLQKVRFDTVDPENDSDDDARMTFTEHLAELRKRLIYSAISVAVGFFAAYGFSEQIFHIVARPLQPLATSAAVAQANQGLYLASVSAEGAARLWDTVIGDALATAKAVAVDVDDQGRYIILANGESKGGDVQGIVVVTDPHPESPDKKQEVVSIDAWEGIHFSDVRRDPKGGFALLGHKDLRIKDDAFRITPIFRRGGPGGEGALDARSSLKFIENQPERGNAGQWTTLSPFEGFIVKLKLSMYAGILFALPILLYNLRAFIFPGLQAKEKRIVTILTTSSGFLVFLGLAVAYWGVFPFVLPYIVDWTPEGVLTQFRMNETVSTILVGMLTFAIAFQLPLVVLILVYLDLLSPDTLKEYRRVAIVGIAFAAAFFTPPDPITMVVMMVPMIVLYEGSIWLSYIVVRKRDQAETAAA